VTLYAWLSESQFDGDKSLLKPIKTKLRQLLNLTKPEPKKFRSIRDRKREAKFSHLMLIARQGSLQDVARELARIRLPDVLGPTPEKTIRDSVDAVVRNAKKLLRLIEDLNTSTDYSDLKFAQKEAETYIGQIKKSRQSLSNYCRHPGAIDWLAGVDATARRLPNIDDVELSDEDAELIDDLPVDLRASMALLQAVGREMLDNPALNMGMQPLEIFCACYMKGERIAVDTYPGFDAWMSEAIRCINNACGDEPNHQWMREPYVVRNLTRFVAWGMLYEHGSRLQGNSADFLGYYKRWMHAALRDGARLDPMGWLNNLSADWQELESPQADLVKPPAPLAHAWNRLDTHEDEEFPGGWPLLMELRIDELAGKGRAEGRPPRSTLTRWMAASPIPIEWIGLLHAFAKQIREKDHQHEARWTTAVTSKLGCFVLLPPDQRDEPLQCSARELLACIQRRVCLMGELRGLLPSDREFSELLSRMPVAIDVNAEAKGTDEYCSQGEEMHRSKDWMFGRLFAESLRNSAAEQGLLEEMTEFALDLYCRALTSKPLRPDTPARILQYFARLSNDGERGGDIWRTWVPPRPVAAGAASDGGRNGT
jgi:hypothetical protein